MEIFRDYAIKKKEPVCGQFLNLLNGSDGFIVNMSSRIIAKIACWSPEVVDKTDLHFYLTWLKDQLLLKVIIVFLVIDDDSLRLSILPYYSRTTSICSL